MNVSLSVSQKESTGNGDLAAIHRKSRRGSDDISSKSESRRAERAGKAPTQQRAQQDDTGYSLAARLRVKRRRFSPRFWSACGLFEQTYGF